MCPFCSNVYPLVSLSACKETFVFESKLFLAQSYSIIGFSNNKEQPQFGHLDALMGALSHLGQKCLIVLSTLTLLENKLNHKLEERVPSLIRKSDFERRKFLFTTGEVDIYSSLRAGSVASVELQFDISVFLCK